MKIVGGPRTESYVLYAAAGALLAGGPLWHYLYVNHYPFSRPEALLLPLLAAMAGAAFTTVAHRIGGLVETVCYAMLLYIFVDLQFELHEYLRAPILFAILFALAFAIHARRAVLTCITLGALYLAALPRGPSPTGPRTIATPSADNARPTTSVAPLLLHVILDEHWGVGGFEVEGDTGTAAFLTEFYQRYGFQLYPAAYSRFHRTVESIPDYMSLGAPANLDPVDTAKLASRRFRGIPYFETLAARGYTIRVFQTSYLDFCATSSSPVASCETQSGNSIANIGYLEGSVQSRAMLAARYWLNVTSHVYRRLKTDPEVWRRASAGGGLQSLLRVREAIERGPRAGTAYLVHVLLPHRPLEVEADCGAMADPAQRIGFDQLSDLSDSSWSATMRAAGAQIRCTYRAFGAIVDAVDRTVGRDSSIIIVHGDHGSRLFQHRPPYVSLAPLDDRQLNGRFSTLLAVRRPGVPPAVVPEPVPTQDFVWRLVSQQFAGPVSTEFAHFVRASRTDSLVADTIRVLTKEQMPWWRQR